LKAPSAGTVFSPYLRLTNGGGGFRKHAILPVQEQQLQMEALKKENDLLMDVVHRLNNLEAKLARMEAIQQGN
jgi:hypothetical protein